MLMLASYITSYTVKPAAVAFFNYSLQYILFIRLLNTAFVCPIKVHVGLVSESNNCSKERRRD